MRYNGARYGPGLFQGKVSHAPLPEIPSPPVSPVPLHTYPPFPPPQLCHILSSSPDVKRYLFFQKPCCFPEKHCYFSGKMGNPGPYRDSLGSNPKGGALVWVHFLRQRKCTYRRKPHLQNRPSFRSSVRQSIRKSIASPIKPK